MSNSDFYTTVICNGDIYKIVTPNSDICTTVMSYSGYPHHYRFFGWYSTIAFHTINRYPQGMPALQPVSIRFSYPHDCHLLQPLTTSIKKMIKITSTTATLALCVITVIVQSVLQRLYQYLAGFVCHNCYCTACPTEIVPIPGWLCVSWLSLYSFSYRDCTSTRLALCVMAVIIQRLYYWQAGFVCNNNNNNNT